MSQIGQMEMMVFYCSECGSATHFHQWKQRKAWSSEQPGGKIKQLQVKCTNEACKKTHVIIPDFLLPYKRYVGAEIEAVIEQKSRKDATPTDTKAEESTMRRWLNQFRQRLPKRMKELEKALINEYNKMVSLLDNTQGMGRLRKLLQLLPQKAAATTLGRANLALFWSGSKLYF